MGPNPFGQRQGMDNTFDPFANNSNNIGFTNPTNNSSFGNFVRPFFSGRYINDPNEIMVKDVPTDGTLALFPYKDCSAIIAKAWNSNGQIVTVKYIVDQSQFEVAQPTVEPNIATILDRLDKLEKSIASNNAISPANTSTKGNSRRTKEDDQNG